MSKFFWRVLFVIGFIPLGAVPMLVAFFMIIACGFTWIAKGSDETRFDRWDAAVVDPLMKPLYFLERKAAVDV